MDRILLAISSAVIGAISTHIYTIFKEKSRKSQIEKQLKLELSDIRLQLQQQLTVYEDAFSLITQSSYPNVLPRSVVAPIYDEFFSEVLLQTKSEHRLAYQKIHHDLSVVNRFNVLWQEEFVIQQKKIYQKGLNPTIEDVKYIIELAENAYFNACVTSWYITRFLENEEQSIWTFEDSINDDYKRRVQTIIAKIEQIRPSR
ncbi:hypothetical protein ERW51_18470 [Aliivibrio finisterrensis]|uniref:hypothetical protein n=1 Tax=Aliivibrio finisterrensis TaxID=511998 RepID=UPI001020BD3B|nr:hypothetical protein [Aliivibrio finisterrensis]RYU66164.1 hypothetical protein ERW51_18470 [Aliivibrio finisterrensis]